MKWNFSSTCNCWTNMALLGPLKSVSKPQGRFLMMGKQRVFVPFRTFRANLEGKKKEVTNFCSCLKFRVCYIPKSLSLIPLGGKDDRERGWGGYYHFFTSLCEPVTSAGLWRHFVDYRWLRGHLDVPVITVWVTSTAWEEGTEYCQYFLVIPSVGILIFNTKEWITIINKKHSHLFLTCYFPMIVPDV